MRVLLEVGNKEVDLEYKPDLYRTEEEKKLFLNLVKNALQSIGYTRGDLLTVWSQEEEK